MKYVQSAIALGLFSWLGYAVYTDTLPIGDGGSGKTRALSGVISIVTEQFGVTQTSIGLGLVGLRSGQRGLRWGDFLGTMSRGVQGMNVPPTRLRRVALMPAAARVER